MQQRGATRVPDSHLVERSTTALKPGAAGKAMEEGQAARVWCVPLKLDSLKLRR